MLAAVSDYTDIAEAGHEAPRVIIFTVAFIYPPAILRYPTPQITLLERFEPSASAAEFHRVDVIECML